MRTEEFETFWKLYPPRWSESSCVWRKSDKEGAWRKWKKMTPKERVLATKAAPSVERSKYTPDARKWLYHKMWEDEVVQVKYDKPKPVASKKAVVIATAAERAEIKQRVALGLSSGKKWDYKEQ